MREVYLVRHSKSSWENPHLNDYDRPLKGRGISDAYLVSQYLRENVNLPSAYYSSPATRALHTALIFARSLNIPFKQIEIEEDLYLCSSYHLLEFLKNLNNTHESVMIFAHNPTITEFANGCQEERIENVPTTGTICLHFDIDDWKDAEMKASIAKFEYPKKFKNKV